MPVHHCGLGVYVVGEGWLFSFVHMTVDQGTSLRSSTKEDSSTARLDVHGEMPDYEPLSSRDETLRGLWSG